jgi:hypothetical protein
MPTRLHVYPISGSISGATGLYRRTTGKVADSSDACSRTHVTLCSVPPPSRDGRTWYRFLRTYLASVADANIRNELLYGFVGEVTESGGALIFTAGLYLAVGIELGGLPEAKDGEAPVSSE